MLLACGAIGDTNNQRGMSADKKRVNHVTLPVLARPVRQNPTD